MSCELFVGNLNPEVRMRDLENCFGRYGNIVRCDLKKNFGFIQFEDRRDAEEAIRKENNRRLLGSDMTVEWAKGSVGDKVGFKGGFRRPRSPDRFNGNRGPPGRDRSPFGGNRQRSPVGRGPSGRDRSPITRSNFGFQRGGSDRFGGSGGGRPFGGRGRDSFESNPRFDSNRSARDKFSGGGRYLNDRGNRDPPMNDRSNRGPPMNDRGNRGPAMNDRSNRGPMRTNGFSDRRGNSGGDRFNERRDSFGERRSFSGPRRF